MKREEVDREGLIAAVETEMPGVNSYLDLRTGEVLTIVGELYDEQADDAALDEIARDNRLLATHVRAEPDRYQLVPSIAPEAGFRWMQEFTASVADEELRGRLQKVLRACADDCFQAFRRAIADAPEPERERWYAFRNEKLEEFIDAWLEGRFEEQGAGGQASGESADTPAA